MSLESLITIYSIMLLVGGAGLLHFGKKSYQSFLVFKQVYNNNKLFKKKQKEREEMLANGELHEWVSYPVSAMKEVNVCRKTGWCPEYKAFFDTREIDHNEKLKELKVEYESYKDDKIAQLANKYNLSFMEAKEFFTTCYQIKKDFYVANLKKVSEEMKND